MALPQSNIRFIKCGHVRLVDNVTIETAIFLKGGLVCIPCTDALLDKIDKQGYITVEDQTEFIAINCSFDNWELA